MPATVIFHQADVTRFAALSGDFNPVHIDPVQARDEMFGQTIVHGIFCCLRMLDVVAGKSAPGTASLLPAKLDIRFLAPVLPDTPYGVEVVETTDLTQIQLQQGGTILVRMLCQHPMHAGAPATSPEPPDELWTPTAPCPMPAPATEPAGTWEPKLHRVTFDCLFPHLSSRLGLAAATDLLACSRLVGMLHPGRYSLFSQLTLQPAPHPAPAIHYQQKRWDARFALVDLTFAGRVLAGSIRAFVRPAPVPIPSMQQACASIAPTLFGGMHVLVVGGTTGLGAATAMLLAAAGANVTLTYAHRQDAAHTIVDAIREAGALARALPFDCANPMLPPNIDPPNWIFYFATPRIFRTRNGPFDESVFADFLQYYVTALARLANTFPHANLFYPSSVAVENPVRGLAEYAAAKFAGEQLCHEMQCAQPSRKAWIERLPRIQTNQTLAIGAPPAPDALPVMADVLQRMARKL